MDRCRDCYGHGKVHFAGEIVPCITCKGVGMITNLIENNCDKANT